MLKKYFKKSQKQEGFGASAIVVILFVLFILYIAFLPPSQRIKLFFNDSDDDTTPNNGNNGGTLSSSITIFQKNIGRVNPQLDNELEYILPSFSVYHIENYQKIHAENDFVIHNNWFSKKDHSISFSGDNINSDVSLSFRRVDSLGILDVYLNDQLIYSGDGKSSITIKQSLIKENNILVFEVSDVGLRFWKNNFYKISDFEIIAKVREDLNSFFDTKFFVSGIELENLKEGNLELTVDCTKVSNNDVDILLNGISVFKGSPNCNIPNIYKFDSSYLREGENQFAFKSFSGSYFVYGVKARLKTKYLTPVPFYFDIDEKVYENKDKYNFNLSISYVTDGRKDFWMTINDQKRNVVTSKQNDWFLIDNFIKEKNNYFLFTTTELLDVAEVRITAKKKD